ncbi:MAG: bifunctional nuclease family protein [Candidatus Aenigmarchaeota archaeon]|nr:bifunctional nuclease family protein [Candidatus Aenigmarchaeota archaeon]
MAKARKKDSVVVYKIVTLIAIGVALVALAQLWLNPGFIPTSLLPISELSTQGYTQVAAQASASGDVGLVTITGNCYEIVANTEPAQAESIANGLEGVVGARPNTHDLMKDELDALGIGVVMVKIVDMRDNTFIGRLILRQGQNIVSLDSRPSDGIAIAVRVGAPIYIEDNLLKAQGKYVC